MTVYVDVLFGLNTAINYLLLRGSAAMGGQGAAYGRFLAAACLGGLYAVAAVVPGLALLQTLPFQVLCAALMLVTAFGWKKCTLRQGLFFFGLSFAFGGLVLLLVQLVEPDCLYLGGRAYYAVTTPALLLLAGVGYGLAALVLTGWGAHTGGEIQSVTLRLGTRQIPVRVLRDTGNTLRDPLTGRSVLVAGWQLLGRLLGESVEQERLRDPGTLLQTVAPRHPGVGLRLIPYRAVGVEQGLLVALRCRLERKGKEQPVLVAFSPTGLGREGQFDAVWGGEIV